MRTCPVRPGFGPQTAADVFNAAAGAVRLADVLGSDMDAGVISRKADPAGAACQLGVVRGLAKLATAQVKAFNTCKSTGIKASTIRSQPELEGCYGATASPASDDARVHLEARLRGACSGTALATAFPGKCAAAPSGGCWPVR